jgi:hypothetical protein
MDEGYEGLDIPYRADFRRPAQIVRQTISHNETQRKAGQRRITNIPIGITNLISGICGYAGNNGLGNKGLLKFGLKNFITRIFW